MTNVSTTREDAMASTSMNAVADKAEEATDRASEKLDGAAGKVERAGRRMGDRVATVADKAASALGSTADYMRDFDARDTMDEMTNIAKRHPMATIAIALAAGFLLGRSATSRT